MILNPSDSKLRRLTQMRRGALALLLLMGVLFIAARLGVKQVPSLEWLQAFAEAAMVGAMADWFAVVALFRHPFGLPIPHTAILQTRQRHIAETLGGFVVENFLSPPVVHNRLERIDLVGWLLAWIGREAVVISDSLCGLVPRLLDSLNQSDVTEFIHNQLQRHVEALPLAPVTGHLLEALTSGGKHEILLDEVLHQADRLLAENATAIEGRIAANIPLPDIWIATEVKQMVAKYVAEKLIAEVQTVLSAAGKDREHPIRLKFTARVIQLVADLKESPEYFAKGEEFKRELLSNPALRSYATTVWEDSCRWLLEQTSRPGAGLQAKLAAFLKRMAESLLLDAAAVARWNIWLREKIGGVVETHRPSVGGMIEDTVNTWDGAELARKLELEVGADLQFIRINGTLIGGLCGLVIHAIGRLFL